MKQAYHWLTISNPIRVPSYMKICICELIRDLFQKIVAGSLTKSCHRGVIVEPFQVDGNIIVAYDSYIHYSSTSLKWKIHIQSIWLVILGSVYIKANITNYARFEHDSSASFLFGLADN